VNTNPQTVHFQRVGPSGLADSGIFLSFHIAKRYQFRRFMKVAKGEAPD